MALQFHPLPIDVFPDVARPAIARFNAEMRDIFALEGVLRNPIQARRSDLSIARRSDVQVDISRITPSLIEGSTSSGAPLNASYITVTNTASLPNERALFAASPLTRTDGGANSVITLGVSDTALAALIPTLVAGTPAILYGTTYIGGTATTFVRADATLKYPIALMSAANASLLTLTDDATDQTLTASLGLLNIVPGSGININFPDSSLASLIVKPNMTTAAALTVVVQGRPTAGSRTLLSPAWFTPASGDTFSSQTFRCWDSQFSTFGGQHTSDTIVNYDCSSLLISPASGSSGGNNLYAFRNNQLTIGNANGSWTDVAAAYFRGARRSITSPLIDVQATVIIEPPTAGLSTSTVAIGSSQIGIYIRQQSAQAIAADRIAIKVDAQNSGTRRYAFYGVSDTLYHGGRFQHVGVQFGIFGATPSTQYGTTGTESGFAAGTSTTVTVDSTFTGNTGTLAYTLGDAIFALKRLGALAY